MNFREKRTTLMKEFFNLRRASAVTVRINGWRAGIWSGYWLSPF